MDETRFDKMAEATLQALESAMENLEEDVEVELSQGILTLTFEEGPAYLINSHRAARQIWMAAERAAWHFEPTEDGSRWLSTKGSQQELWEVLAAALSQKFGRTVTLR